MDTCYVFVSLVKDILSCNHNINFITPHTKVNSVESQTPGRDGERELRIQLHLREACGLGFEIWTAIFLLVTRSVDCLARMRSKD